MYVTRLLLIHGPNGSGGDQECIFFTLNTCQATFISDTFSYACRNWKLGSGTGRDGTGRTDGQTDRRRTTDGQGLFLSRCPAKNVAQRAYKQCLPTNNAKTIVVTLNFNIQSKHAHIFDDVFAHLVVSIILPFCIQLAV